MQSPRVTTAYGALRGISTSREVSGFRGVPYAAPPVGPLRWRPPEGPSAWSGIREAAIFGPDPIQGAGNAIRVSRAPTMSEDCLYLNIWAPKQHRAGGWPVLVWSGGGAFTTGGGAFVDEDPTQLAARGAVVVSVNIRLNVFGFFAHAALSAESPQGSSGNYGLLDQAAAFKWVRENIHAFNGDGNRVTFFGGSAGASVSLLLLSSPIERGLFDRAIFQSPGSFSSLLSLEDAERHGAGLGDTADEMRRLSAGDLVEKAQQLPAVRPSVWLARPMRPIVDGWLIVSDDPLSHGNFTTVPAIIGTNEDEGGFFAPRMAVKTIDDYRAFVRDVFGDRATEALARYPVTGAEDVAAMFSTVYGDRGFNYPIDGLVRAFARSGSDVYRYVYTYRQGKADRAPLHSEETGVLMNTRPHIRPQDAEMADIMARYWIAFAETGNPHSAGLLEWPEYTESTNHYMKLDVPPSVESNWRCDAVQLLADLLPEHLA